MRSLVTTILLLSMVTLSACRKDYRNDPFMEFDKDLSGFKSASDSRDLLKMDPFHYGDTDKGSFYQKALAEYNDGKEPKARYYRNALLEAMIVASDANTSSHLAGLKATQSNVNLLFGAAALGLTGGAAVAPAVTASALAAASTGVQGARTLINDEVYSQAFSESIIMLITEDRKVTAELIRRNYTKSMTDYPLERAIADVSAYHESGSVYYGLALARQAIEKETIRKRGEISRLGSLDGELTESRSTLTNMESRLKEIASKLVDTQRDLDRPDLPADSAERLRLTQLLKQLKDEQKELGDAIPRQKAILQTLIEAAKARLDKEKSGL
jgi:hypothetical protein